MRIFTFFALLMMLISLSFGQTSIEVEDNIDFKLALDYAFATPSVDTLFLVTSGGVYTTTDSIYFEIKKPLVIMAKPGLAEKPIFTHSDGRPIDDADKQIEMFRVYDDITFEGIIFDGGMTHGLKHCIRLGHGPEDDIPRSFAKEGLNIIVKNCDFRDFYEDNDRENEGEGHAMYFLRPNTGEPVLKAGTVKFENCTFRDIGDEAIRISETEKYEVERVVDSLIVRNCSFRNISAECIRFYADTDTSTADAYVLIEHITVDNSCTRMAYIKNNRGTIFRDNLVTNSRLPKLSRAERSDYVIQIQEKGSIISHLDTLNMVFQVPEPSSGRVSATKGGEVDTLTIYAFDPLYADAANFDYTLAANSPAYGKAFSGVALGDLRWADPANSVAEFSSHNVPELFELSQNYPNPFNPVTTISYSLSQPGNVTLMVYDITGKTVATLVDTRQSAGTYQVDWQPANRASGVYFYRLNYDNQSVVKKMMLIR
jgi:hypothetical protein